MTAQTALVVCDWNGTLVDDIDRATRATQRMLARFALTIDGPRAFTTAFRLPLAEFLADLGVPTDAIPEAIELWNREMRAEPAPMAHGANALLRDLARHGNPVGVVSAADRAVIEHDVRHHHLKHVLGFVHASVEDKASRLQMIARQTSRPAIYVGDTEHDMNAARRAGMQAIGVSNGYRTPEQLTAAGAEHVVADLTEIIELTGPATSQRNGGRI